MRDDKLKLFTNEDEIKQYCKVNGNDDGLINTMVARWKSLAEEPIVVYKATSKKITRMMESDAIESKNETDPTE